MVRDLADAVSGSFKEFAQLDHDPMRSINFITAHDGFTLNDVVSYNDKHNQANGEHNRDGSDQNNSWNCGAEGPTDDLQGETLRMQQVCNFFTILLLSQGRPMFLLGDEVRRTQQGNNNAYSQDNEISWFEWNQVEAQRGLLRFVRGLLKFRQISGLFRDRSYWFEHAGTDIIWHGVRLGQPDWGENSHCLAFELVHPEIEEHLYELLNAFWEPLEFELPNMGNGSRWARLVDTSKPAPEDFCDPVELLPDGIRSFPVQARAAVVLVEQRFNNNNQAVGKRLGDCIV